MELRVPFKKHKQSKQMKWLPKDYTGANKDSNKIKR